MQCLMLIFVFVGVVYSHDEDMLPEVKKIVYEMADKCIKETGADMALLEKSKSGEPTDDRNVKCFYKCMMISFGTMDTKGAVHLDKQLDQIPSGPKHDQFKGIVDSCKDVKQPDPCETAYKVHQCTVEYSKTMLKQ